MGRLLTHTYIRRICWFRFVPPFAPRKLMRKMFWRASLSASGVFWSERSWKSGQRERVSRNKQFITTDGHRNQRNLGGLRERRSCSVCVSLLPPLWPSFLVTRSCGSIMPCPRVCVACFFAFVLGTLASVLFRRFSNT